MSKIPTISSLFLMPLFYCLSEKGVLPEKICKGAGVDIDLVRSPDHRFTVYEMNRLIESALALAGDKNLGFDVGKTYSLLSSGIVGHVLMHCKTIGDALEKYCSYQELPGDIVRISLTRGNPFAKIHWKYNPAIVSNPPFVMEIIIAAVLSGYMELSGKAPLLTEARFDYKKPYNAEEYKRFLKCELKFEEEETAIYFLEKSLEIPVKHPNKELLDMLEAHCSNVLRDFYNRSSFSGRVEKKLRIINGKIPSIDDIADDMGISARNLQGKLKQEGTTFREIKEKVQRDLATQYIMNDQYSVAEISDMLGFSEPCAFRRTFKRWTGKTPGQFR